MNRQIGLALGGGGARGLAHLGVLKVLEENSIPINYIAGTSMGAVIGAMYAQFPHVEQIIDRWLNYLRSPEFNSLGTRFIVRHGDQFSPLSHFISDIAQRVVINISPNRASILKTERLTNALNRLIADDDIQNTLIPFCAVASDLNSGRTVVLRTGNIREAVTISSSIPGFIAPHARDGQLLTDGGVTAAVPVENVRAMGAQFVIGVNVGINTLQPLTEPNIIDILSRSDLIRGIEQADRQLSMADIQIHPNVKDAHWSEFYRFEEFIQAGIDATRAVIPAIKEKIRTTDSFFQTIFSKFIGKHDL